MIHDPGFPELDATVIDLLWSNPQLDVRTWSEKARDTLATCGLIEAPSPIAQLFKGIPCRMLVVGQETTGKSTLLAKQLSPYGGRDIEFLLRSLHLDTERLVLNNSAIICAVRVGDTCPVVCQCCARKKRVVQGFLRGCTVLVWIMTYKRDELPVALEELSGHINDEGVRENIPLLVLANKQLDSAGDSLSIHELRQEVLGACGALLDTRPWYVVETDLLSGEGLIEAFQWLKMMIRNYNTKNKDAN